MFSKDLCIAADMGDWVIGQLTTTGAIYNVGYEIVITAGGVLNVIYLITTAGDNGIRQCFLDSLIAADVSVQLIGDVIAAAL